MQSNGIVFAQLFSLIWHESSSANGKVIQPGFHGATLLFKMGRQH